MIPLGDDQVRGAGSAIANWALIAINAVVFVYEITLGEPAIERLFQTYGVVPAAVTHGQGLIGLLTSMFLHGGWLHLVGNMLFLGIFGDNVEAVLGHVGYLAFYLLGGLAGSAGQILAGPSSTLPSVGASGAIAAVLGAYIVMFPRSRVRVLLILGFFFTVTRVRAVVFLGVWIVLQLLSGVASLSASTTTSDLGGVGWFAHIGGFIFGLAGGVLMHGRAKRLEYRVYREPPQRW